MNIPPNEFKLNTIKPNSVILLIGGRDTGKTTICCNIINEFRDIPAKIIIAPSGIERKTYSSLFPTAMIYHEFN